LAAAAAAAAAGTVGYGPAGAGFGLANESASETGYSAQRNILDARELRFFEQDSIGGNALAHDLFASPI